MRKQYRAIRVPVTGRFSTAKYLDELNIASENGYNIESCGMDGACQNAWAIMSRPVEETPKQINLVEAVKEIAWMCETRQDCNGCPLDRHNKCLASGGRGSGVPSGWLIAKEEHK